MESEHIKGAANKLAGKAKQAAGVMKQMGKLYYFKPKALVPESNTIPVD